MPINNTKTKVTNDSSQWFSPIPSASTAKRLSLDFGLRSDDLFFRELIVPGIGSVWFVRQLSWPLAALALRKKLPSSRLRPAEICYAIEALACKLEFKYGDKDSRRTLGRRAFERDENGGQWSFSQLRKVTNYVRNTHRQAAIRAIRSEQGLGLAHGTRFDLFELEPVGLQMAEAFLSQRVGQGRGTTLETWLRNWIEGQQQIPDKPKTLREALTPERATQKECDLIRTRLLGIDTLACKKRQQLARVIGRAASLSSIEDVDVTRLRNDGHTAQADEVLAACAFGAMLDRARDVVSKLTSAVESVRGSVALTTLAKGSDIQGALENLRKVANSYIERAGTAKVQLASSHAFAKAFIDDDGVGGIRFLVQRSDQVLGLANGTVSRGPLFRIVPSTDGSEAPDNTEDDEQGRAPDFTGRTFRLANLHALLRDLNAGGAQ
ncbi:MAG: hypothetical protein HKL99_17400 [Burkholderiales bacterium]|nr:hypothetical protein [Burkholderiales bacterium]